MTWTAPDWTLLVVPPVLLTAQSTLCQLPQTPPLRLFRLALIPPCILAVLRYCDTFFTPKQDFVIFNIVIQITKAWAVARSIELGTASAQYRWIGYIAAYRGSKDTRKDTRPETQPISLVRATRDGWSNLCSLRGTGWSWGIKGDQIPAPHKSAGSLLLILAWSQLLTVASVALVITTRRNGGPELYLAHLLSLSPSPTLSVAARALHVLCVGTAIYTSLEMGFAALTLAVMVSTAILRVILPSSLAPRPFDLRAWPRLMSWSGPGATSLHSFWGSRWHALFRRLFLHVGSKPATTVLSTVGAGKALQSAAGAFGAFAVSGLMHESYNEATSYLPRDPHYDTFKFFLLQPFGIILESIWTKSTGKKVGGWLGFLWTFAFLLATGNLMVDCWIKRGAVDFAPPLSQWEWWRWTLPFGFVFPAAL